MCGFGSVGEFFDWKLFVVGVDHGAAIRVVDRYLVGGGCGECGRKYAWLEKVGGAACVSYGGDLWMGLG